MSSKLRSNTRGNVSRNITEKVNSILQERARSPRKSTPPLELAPPTQLQLAPLAPDVRNEIKALRDDLIGEIRAASLSQLRIGELLYRTRAKLDAAKQKRLLRSFILSLPGLSVPAAYRHMVRWENAERHLPGPVRAYALTSGVDLAGVREAEPFGKYTQAVRQVGTPPAPSGSKRRDDEAAQQYVKAVTAAHAKLYRAATRKSESYAGLVKHGAEQMGKLVARVDVGRREPYLREVVAAVLSRLAREEAEREAKALATAVAA